MKRDNVAYVRRELTSLIKQEVRRLRGLNRKRDADGTRRWLENTAVCVAESEVRLKYLIDLSGTLHDHARTLPEIIQILTSRRAQINDLIRVERLWKVEGSPGNQLVRQASMSAYMDLLDWSTGPLGRLWRIAVNLYEGRKPDEGRVRPATGTATVSEVPVSSLKGRKWWLRSTGPMERNRSSGQATGSGSR